MEEVPNFVGKYYQPPNPCYVSFKRIDCFDLKAYSYAILAKNIESIGKAWLEIDKLDINEDVLRKLYNSHRDIVENFKVVELDLSINTF